MIFFYYIWIYFTDTTIENSDLNTKSIKNGLKRKSDSFSSAQLNQRSFITSNIPLSSVNGSDVHNLTRPETPDEENEVDKEEINGTPPLKKSKFFFKRCFEATFDAESFNGKNKILAEDSDEDDG